MSPMPRIHLALALLVALAAARAGAEDTQSAAAGVTVTCIRGKPVAADGVEKVEEGKLVLVRGESRVEVPLDDTIEISFATAPDPPRQFAPEEVEIELWSGERLHGRIQTGDAEGLTLDTPLLGSVQVTLDHLAGVHFRKRLSEVVEPPDLSAAGSDEHPDTIHMVGGDRIRCTLERLEPKGVRCSTAASDDAFVAYERMTALRLGQVGEPPKPGAGISLDVVLRDGTRLTGTGPSVEKGRLGVRSRSGFDAAAELRDVVAVHVRSDAFRYLSDLEAPEVAVKPFWKTVAGDPVKLYAPRMDRSWSGGPLRCGGRTWLKGIGVFSGTSLSWTLDGTYSEFRALAGLDDAAGRLGGVVFEVWVDGERKWTSGFVRPAGAEGRGKPSPQDVGRIALVGARRLTLKVLSGDDEDPYPIQDHADWLGAMLVK
jgi:hypothetical protein